MAYQNPTPKIEDETLVEDRNAEPSDYTTIEKVYFAFIDVLGFKKAFDDLKISNNEEAPNKYRDVFNYYFSLMNSAKFMQGEKTGCYAGQTSDSLYFYTEREDYLLQFIKIFSHFNLYAMSNNVFFRGGIAKGNLYKKEQYQFFGDSVIDAYLLESNISKYPIIVIDESTHLALNKDPEYKRCVNDLKERHYIKPFEFLWENEKLDLDDSTILKSYEPQKIKDNIEKNKQLFEYDVKNYEKYTFLLKEFTDAEELKNKITGEEDNGEL
ncbi:MAG: hypothetical protein HFE25_07715 [Clostridia bacterium]|jgi:hypothetical protein|nr:hypothetical protein [Clostridia bacterium]